MNSDNTQKPHLIFVGFHPSAINSIDCEHNRISIIVHDHVAKNLDGSVRNKLTDIGIINVPHNMNLEEYIDAMPQIEKVAAELIKRHGLPEGFVALYEHVTLPAAILRERYNIHGTSVKTALLCRDKVKMKQALSSSSVRCPMFMAVDSETSLSDIKCFVKKISGKIVLKPRAQAASEGISIFNDACSLLDFLDKNGIEDRYEIEEYVSGTLCHFDGVIRKGKLLFFSASSYTTTCFNYVYKNIPLASITIDDTALHEKAKNYSENILGIVGLEDGIFHLEAFLTDNNELVFLEVANRFGGAGVVPQMQKMYGIDLIKETIASDTNKHSCIRNPIETINLGFSSAWLYIPLPTNKSCQVGSVSGLEKLTKEVVAFDVVKPGDWLNTSVSPFPFSGRFFIKAGTSQEVQIICQHIIKNYKVTIKKIRKEVDI